MSISNIPLPLECPSCHCEQKITLQQIADEEVIKCPHCGQTIQLMSENNSAQQAAKSLRELDSLFR